MSCHGFQVPERKSKLWINSRVTTRPQFLQPPDCLQGSLGPRGTFWQQATLAATMETLAPSWPEWLQKYLHRRTYPRHVALKPRAGCGQRCT